MGLLSWIFYFVIGFIFFLVLGFFNDKYKLTKIQKLIISVILMLLVSGFCFKFAINYTDNIFLVFVFLMIIDIIYSTYFIEKDFFDKNEKNIEYYILLVIVGFIINQEFINDVSEVFLTGEDLRVVLWFLIIVFIYNFVKEKEILDTRQEVKNKYMSSQAVLVSYVKLKHKFYDECCSDNNDLVNIVFAIMIFENSRRSRLLRNYDYFMFRLDGNKRKLGIMQIESKKFITDGESIELTFKALKKIIDKKNKGDKNKANKTGKIKAETIIDSYCGENADYVKYIFDIIKKF